MFIVFFLILRIIAITLALIPVILIDVFEIIQVNTSSLMLIIAVLIIIKDKKG